MNSGVLIWGQPPIATRMLAEMVRCSISSITIDRMSPRISSLVPGFKENIAVRYGGMVACSSSMAFCRYWYRSSFRPACSTPAINSRRTFNMGLASLFHVFSGLELQEELGLAGTLDRLQVEL